MIDTLKLSKQLQEAEAQTKQAEGIAAGLAEGVKERFVTNDRLTAELAKLKTELIGLSESPAAQTEMTLAAAYFMLLRVKP